MESHGRELLGSSYVDPITSFSLFQQFSASKPEVSIFIFLGMILVQCICHSLMWYDSLIPTQVYWSIILKELAVSFHVPPRCVLDTTDKSKHVGTWLPGAVMNIANCCIQPSVHPQKEDSSVVLVWREESDHESSQVKCLTLHGLREQVMYAHILPLSVQLLKCVRCSWVVQKLRRLWLYDISE